MNKLIEAVIRSYIHEVAFHTDIQKNLKLSKVAWREFASKDRQQEIDPTKIPKEKVIKTLIYGLNSGVNQAECCLREKLKVHKTSIFKSIKK